MAGFYRIVVYCITLLLVILTAWFSVRNTSIAPLNLPFFAEQISLPVYLSHLIFFLAGAVLAGLYFLWSHLRSAVVIGHLRRKLKKLSLKSESTPPQEGLTPVVSLSEHGESRP